jgi:hypothetical protein
MAQGLFTLRQVNHAIRQGAWTGIYAPTFVEYLCVAGGGGGGKGNGGGGGAGGLLTGMVPVTAGTSYTVTVGTGGAGATSFVGTSGVNSVFGPITSIAGGGGGGGNTTPPVSGGSGGGAGTAGALPGAQGVSGQGNAGGVSFASGIYPGGGGGGAGTVGNVGAASGGTGGNGGAGIASVITGTVTTYAGGGGGGVDSSTAGTGGVGGGGAGGSNAVGSAGTANTGGGGGGAGYTSGTAGGAGGSGIVVVSYPDVYAAATSTTGSPTVSTSGSGSITGPGGTNMIVYPATNNSSYAFGTSNFTIEFWVYATSVSALAVIYDGRPSLTNGAYPTIFIDSGGIIYYYTNGATQITGSTLSINTWYHIAVARSGTSTKMFVNGTQVGSTYTDTNTYLNSYPFLASNSFSVGADYLVGAMTNVRINNTTAVYTSNFTTPTAPLTPISGTVLLLNCNSGSYLTDSSSISSLVRTAGPAQWSSLSPFATGAGYKNRVYTWTSSGSITI